MNNSSLKNISEHSISRAKLVIAGTNSEALAMLNSGPDSILAPLAYEGGIVFHNTPNISIAYTSQYSQVELTHTNYDFQSFTKSAISDITINCRFSAQTIGEADYLLAVFHYLRTFNKMHYGQNDPYRGMPPVIHKFSAYGDFMINNVPVVIRHFNLNLPDNVDYVQTSHNTQVPILSEFQITLAHMPTPNKVRKEFSLDAFANGSLVKKGYL